MKYNTLTLAIWAALQQMTEEKEACRPVESDTP